jgi:hypothetical protein
MCYIEIYDNFNCYCILFNSLGLLVGIIIINSFGEKEDKETKEKK